MSFFSMRSVHALDAIESSGVTCTLRLGRPESSVRDAVPFVRGSPVEATSMSPTNDVLTIKEVARELRCSAAHVYNLINGKIAGVRPLPVIPLGRRKLVLRSSLDDWKRANEQVLTSDILPSSPEVDAVDA